MSTIGHNSWSTARRSALLLLLALLLLAVVATGAGARGHDRGTRVVAPPGAGTNLSISGEAARLVGSEALIAVECEGPREAFCSGTLTVHKGRATRRAPYSVLAGSHQSLSVTVGRGFAGSGQAAVAVARTAESAGGYAESRAVIRFR
jgi:hypothetical protein